MDFNVCYRKKDGGYQCIVSYKHNGKWKQKSKQGFSGKQEAKDYSFIIIDKIKKSIKEDKIIKCLTLQDLLDLYVSEKETYRSPNSIRTFKNAVNQFKCILEKDITKITGKDIQKEVDRFIFSGLKQITIKHYIMVLTIILKFAIEESYLIELPSFNVDMPKPSQSVKKALNMSELESILLEFKDTNYHLPLSILIYTGMRIGESMGLTWDSIDFKKNTITISTQWQRDKNNKYDFAKLKSTNSYRVIPMNDKLKEILEPLRSKGRVISKYKSTGSLSVLLNEKLKPYNITAHELRHTLCTTLIANGLDFKTVAYLMGHTVEMTMTIYSHYNNDMNNKAVNILNNIF